MAAAKKIRLDQLLVERQLAADLKLAQALILSGKILVRDTVISKCGYPVSPAGEIRLRGKSSRYVSRGGYKLAAALQRFPVQVQDEVVLDAGASTGGFTDCLLQHGARLVYAVDAGYGQLRGSLASHPRVINLEKTNISDLTIRQLDPRPSLGTADLSYLSLTTAIPILSRLLQPPVRLICLVKPLFEGLAQSRPGDPAALGPVLEQLFTALAALTTVADVVVSPITGTRGTVEFLILVDETAVGLPSPRDLTTRALDDLTAHPPCEPA